MLRSIEITRFFSPIYRKWVLFAQILAIKADKRRSFHWHGRNRTVVLEGNRQETKETDKAKPPSTKRSSHKEVRKERQRKLAGYDFS